MSLPLSRELGDVIDEANDIADRVEQTLSSAHLLLALFTVPNRAAVFLEDRNVTVDKLLEKLSGASDEAPAILDRIYQRGERIASGSRAEAMSSLHLLAALVRESSSQAVELLKDAGINVSAIRASVMSYATGSTPLPRRFRTLSTTTATTTRPAVSKKKQRRSEDAPSPIGFHPSLGIADPSRRKAAIERNIVETTEPVAEQAGPEDSGSWRTPTDEPPRPRQARRLKPRRTKRSKSKPGNSKPSESKSKKGKPTKRPQAKAPDAPSDDVDEASMTTPPSAGEAIEDARQTAQNLAARLFSKNDEVRDEAGPVSDEFAAPQGAVADDSEASEAVDEASSDELPEVPEADGAASLAEESSTVDNVRFDDPLEPDEGLAQSYDLDPEQYPNLVKFGRNLTAQAARGQIDRVVGRDREILQLIDILGKRRSNNPVLVGEAGVGKTAIVEGLSREFVKLANAGNRLGKRAIIELELGRILSGTHLRGSFSERLLGIKDEVEQAGGDVIVFLDELHSWMTAGAGGDGTDAAGELKTALARGRFPCIGATTNDEFRQFVESDPAFERRFGMVFVEEPDVATARHIAGGIRGHYEKHHEVRYADEALDAAVRLSHRYIYQRRLPDKAIGVLDLAGSRAARTGQKQVDRPLVAEIVAEMAGIPVERLTQTDRERFLNMESYLADGIVGHRHIVQSISDVIRRNYAGFRGRRPIGSLLFLGPTGVGKTEMVKVLADFLFHDRDAVVRLDMSEFMEAHSVSRMVGAPPGYVGYEQGGQLTEAVRRRPYQIVLLDEIEKAHPDVLNILLQLFDEGQLTDGRSRTVDFSNTVIVMTSNLGADVFSEQAKRTSRGRIGFGKSDRDDEANRLETTDKVRDAAQKHFTPELWNRIDEKLVFMPLTRKEVAGIARLQLEDSRERLHEESGIDLEFDDGVIAHLIDNGGFNPELGARPMRQTIQRLVEGAVARLILSGEVSRGDTMRVEIHGDEVVCVAI
ncbi:AAA family ATPase [Persicimonas caeni]|uniref:AAA family ATPase n=1 Tax=Persicimonas caeni TaxID=2292766 RepID=A0A4Y6Q0T1_PERCE|nr:AAA family ATPase [Persicimonas caeni]QDG54184.1 AAA family ATPase [Persicimonas caeni]QED35405.1 AAA family ATPase [Persicimonas caeni]